MESQSVRSPEFLACILICILVLNTLIRLRKRNCSNLKTYSYLLELNYFFPILSYLAFSDQLDESYIWASKIQNLLTSGRMGVELFDGVYGESSVSILQPVISSVLKSIFPITYEQAMYLPGVISLYILIYLWTKTAASFSLSFISSILPIGFLITSFGFIQNISFSFDVPLSLLALFIVYTGTLGRSMPRMAVLVIAGLTPLIRMEFILLVLLWVCAIGLQAFNGKQKNSITLKSVTILIGPTLLAFLYKLWAFGELLPAMYYFKVQNYDVDTILYILAYYCRALGYFATAILVIAAFTSIVRGKALVGFKTSLSLYVRLPLFQKLTLIFIGVQFLTPVLAGADYHGERLQRYLVIPLSICVFAFVIHKNIVFDGFSKKFFVKGKAVISILVLLIAINSESHVYAIKAGTWFDLENRPSRAYCHELLGPELRKFWQSKSNMPLVIATSEANGIAFSSGARLLDLAGGVDARNYPAKRDPISPGNLYGKYTFKNSIARELPSILWPYKSEHCIFYNRTKQIDNIELMSMLEATYSQSWTKYWFPNLENLLQIGYCPGKIQSKFKEEEALAVFLYYCGIGKPQ
jgi:hypothetical protein